MDDATNIIWTMRKATARDRTDIVQLQERLHRPARSDSSILEYFVAECEGKIIGCAGVRKRNSFGYLYGLVVDKPWRRKGVGHALTQQRLDWLSHENVRSVFVLAMFWNVKFFKKHCFTLTDKEKSRMLAGLHRDFVDPWSSRSALLSLELPSRTQLARNAGKEDGHSTAQS